MTTAEVTCPAGTIVGVQRGAVRHFHSIEYSRISAPFNDALPAERGLLIDATVPRPEKTALSVTTPANATDADDLPVMVWIHGGRFEEGNHADPDTGAEAFAAQDVIQVRVGYRKTLPGLVQFPDDDPCHFRAAHDCQLALEWVQRNIEAFGGDPTNITLVGQSAGANLVLWLARRDHYRGAFRRAVAMSPAFPRRTFAQRKASLRASLSMPLTREALNSADPRKLQRGYRRFRTRHITDLALGPGPLEPGELADVDLVVTSTRDEFYRSGARTDAMGTAPFGVRFAGMFMDLDHSEVRDYLAACREIDPDHLQGRFISDSLVRRFVDRVAEGAPGRVWQAEFVSETGQPAHHCDDLPSLFAQPPHAVGEGLNGWMARFCADGEPGWPTYKPGRRVLRTGFSCAAPELVTDPLGYLRRAFKN
ncbi:carboxylesterase family protein [Corynebacterium qintianiae]|uniref:Carboxylic ester hydrolase n=1 Tax=Corynebacterium qintianiae TaxID=2709392 RepID=A0A7T0PFG8_9CORY|nr:carboxylesterase family protein [Corynebacterium qintianiae]QPK82817.1 carboxylesterase family protein [Corynebacterium qintianiae]